MSRLSKTATAVERLTMLPLLVAGAAMVAIVVAGTFWRYVLGDPLLWTEEAARYLMIWIALIGASVCIRHGEHVRVEMLVRLLPGVLRKAVDVVVALLILVFLAVLVWIGGGMAVEAMRQVSPALGVPMAVPLAVIPLSGALMALQLILRLAMLATGERGGVFDWDEPDRDHADWEGDR